MAIMKSFQGAFEREIKNEMQQPNVSKAFKSTDIDAMFDLKRKYILTADINYVFITIDPSAGTGRSFYVLVSMFYPKVQNKRLCVVCFFYLKNI
jgi:glycyl-tRNA synthetase (class II)